MQGESALFQQREIGGERFNARAAGFKVAFEIFYSFTVSRSEAAKFLQVPAYAGQAHSF